MLLTLFKNQMNCIFLVQLTPKLNYSKKLMMTN